jgi:hypothetical protein
MAQITDLFPPIDANEKAYVAFDFAPELTSGTTITSATVTCLSVLGVDSTPEARLLDYPAIAPSPSTGVQRQAVRQLIGQMVGGERYRLQCLAQISDGQVFNIDTHVDCNAVA